MKPSLLYILGEPGVGKTTAIKIITEPHRREEVAMPFAHIRYLSDPAVVELGGRREAFSGTDVLGMNVQPKVVEFLTAERPPLVLAEGDRLANSKFFHACINIGYDIRLVFLYAPEATVSERRAGRVAELGGSAQSPVWLKGRSTKVLNLLSEWSPNSVLIDASKSPEEVAETISSTGGLVAAALKI